MPDLNRRQFHQPEIDRFYSADVVPHGLKGKLPGANIPTPPPTDPNDPARTFKRGTVGEGQMIMNFDEPDVPLEHRQAGLIPIDSYSDPDWDRSAWHIGGANRDMAETIKSDPDGAGWASDDDLTTVTRTEGWERAPVETIGPDDQLRTNQLAWGEFKGAEPDVDIDEDKVETLRAEGAHAFKDPTSGEQKLPWVAQVADKRYLMEGHHRAISARTRDTGEFPAHVLRGGNWGQIEEQLYDGPWTR